MNKVEIDKKENKILNEIPKNSKICRRVYKYLYNFVADNFLNIFQFFNYEINEVNEDIKTNSCSLVSDVRNHN